MPRKIDPVELHKMRKQKKTRKECAAHFGVSEVAIWKAERRLSHAVVASATLEAAHKVLDQDLNIRGQLVEANQTINNLISEARKDLANAKDGLEKRGIQKVTVHMLAELRKQAETFLKIIEAWDDHVNIADFQRAALDTIEAANISECCHTDVVCGRCHKKIDLRTVVIRKLKEAKALRSGITIAKP